VTLHPFVTLPPTVNVAGIVSVIVTAAVVAVVPVLVRVSVYEAGTPTTKLEELADFTRASFGELTGVLTTFDAHDEVQFGSPPPEISAEFDTTVPAAAALGVTDIANDVGALVARPAAIVHVTS
jgi:hypothetical protein